MSLWFATMSSTYMHYNSGPASLPNDYAILSEYISSQRSSEAGFDSPDEDLTETEDDEAYNEPPVIPVMARRISGRSANYGTATSPSRRIRASLSREAVGSGVRKSSFGGHTLRSPHWKAPELEPLLADIPRIDEDCDVESLGDAQTWALWFQEGNIIARYTLPVFG